SPFAGTLRADPDMPWPGPGRGVKAGQVLGRVDVRIGPQERLDLQSKLSEARLRYVGAEDVLRVQQERVNRLKPSPRSEFVRQGELAEAMGKLTEARPQLATARAAVDLWERALASIERPNGRPNSSWSEPLAAPADGEVTELSGRPGMAIEAGGLV